MIKSCPGILLPCISRYPPFTDSRKKTMAMLNKFGGVMVGDIKKVAYLVLFMILLAVAYYFGLLDLCCLGIGNADQHDHHSHGHDHDHHHHGDI